ncbi:MAG: hypothetical protein GC154_07235 [bacterium]|nr:hypothetical protein [bacterium]
MDDMATWAIRFLVTSSAAIVVLGGIAWGLARWARIQGAGAFWMYAAVMLAPLCLPLQSVTPAGWRLHPPAWPETRIDAAAPMNSSPISSTAQKPQRTNLSASPPKVTIQVLEPLAQPKAAPQNDFRNEQLENTTANQPQTASIPWKLLFLLSWGVGVITAGIRVAFACHRLNQRMLETKPVTSESAHAIAMECAERIGLNKPPRLRQCAICQPPMLAGLFKPQIIIPDTMLDPGKENQLRFTLLHEMAHQKRKDHWWIAVELALSSLYFFHPVIHWLTERLHHEREHLCDRFVVNVTRMRASYLDFLLTEAWTAGQPHDWRPALPFAASRTRIADRIDRILHETEKTMRNAIQERLSLTLFAAMFTAVFLFHPAGAQEEKPLDYAWLNRMDNPSDFYVIPVFDDLDYIMLRPRGPRSTGAAMKLSEGKGYSYDPNTRIVSIQSPLQDGQGVMAYGRLKTPWEFQAQKAIEEGSVKLLIGDTICERNNDYMVDSTSGRIRLLNESLCKPRQLVVCEYRHLADPRFPQRYAVTPYSEQGGVLLYEAIKSEDARRFLGLPEHFAPDSENIVGTNATKTDDPRIYRMTNVMKPETMNVGIASRDRLGEMKWLTSGADYQYDPETGTIAFAQPLSLGADEFVFVQGEPKRNVFMLEPGMRQGSVTVTVDDRSLKEGTDFKLDYDTGKLTINETAAIIGPHTRYSIQSPGHMFGNYSPRGEGQTEWKPSPDHDPDVDPNDTVGTNAMRIGKSNKFRLYSPFQVKGLQVSINKLKYDGAFNWLKRGVDYDYDESTATITLRDHVRVKDDFDTPSAEREYLFVQGVPTPNVFLVDGGIKNGSIRVMLEGNELTEGHDYQADYDTGRVAVTHPAILKKHASYYVTATSKNGRTMSFGNGGESPQSDYVPSPDVDPDVDYSESIGMSPLPTDDPRVYVFPRPIQQKGLLLGIGNTKTPGISQWLLRGEEKDYVYNEKKSQITFLHDLTLKEDEYIFASAIPNPRNVFYGLRTLKPGEISVSLNGKTLKEGEGYTVDYVKGIVTVLDPAINLKEADYSIKAGDQDFTLTRSTGSYTE